jgi:hypothetical protein
MPISIVCGSVTSYFTHIKQLTWNEWLEIYLRRWKGTLRRFSRNSEFRDKYFGYPYRPTEFYRNRTRNVESRAIFLSRWVKNIFHCTDFNETHTCSTALCGYILHGGGTRWRSRLRPCATSQKVARSIPDSVNGIFHWQNPSGRTQPLTEMSTRNISWEVKAASV